MLKRTIPLLLVVIILIQGCAKVETSEYITAPVFIRDADFQDGYAIYGKYGPIIYPDQYTITVVYKGAEYYLFDEDTYNAFKDRVGETTNGIFRLDFYDNGVIQYNLISLD